MLIARRSKSRLLIGLFVDHCISLYNIAAWQEEHLRQPDL